MKPKIELQKYKRHERKSPKQMLIKIMVFLLFLFLFYLTYQIIFEYKSVQPIEKEGEIEVEID